MIGKIERGAAQPTAALLGKLAGALGMTLSELIAQAEGIAEDRGRLVRLVEQPVWVDPDTGYRRRAVSPAPGGPLERPYRAGSTTTTITGPPPPSAVFRPSAG